MMGRPGNQQPVVTQDPMGRLLNPIFGSHGLISKIPASIKSEIEEEARERREKLDREAAERRRREGG